MTDHEHQIDEVEVPAVDINEIRRKLGIYVSESVQDNVTGPKLEKNHGQAPDLNNLMRNPKEDA